MRVTSSSPAIPLGLGEVIETDETVAGMYTSYVHISIIRRTDQFIKPLRIKVDIIKKNT